MCFMAMLYFKVYSSVCILYCDCTHILLPTINCTQLYLGDKVYRSEKLGSHSHPTNDSDFLRRCAVSTGMWLQVFRGIVVPTSFRVVQSTRRNTPHSNLQS